jgi:hypothetical protein
VRLYQSVSPDPVGAFVPFESPDPAGAASPEPVNALELFESEDRKCRKTVPRDTWSV